MRRRQFFAVVAASMVVAWPLWTHAQSADRTYRIGFLFDSPSVFPDAVEAFRQGLRDLGYVEGHNVVIEYRWAEGRTKRMRELADELARMKVDVIMAPTSVYTGVAKQATATIPIIFMSHADPLGSGHVASLARPGGNVTGLSIMMTETNVKGLELFKEAVPGLSRVAVIFDPATPSHRPGLQAVEAAGPALRVQVLPVPVKSAAEFDAAFAAIEQGQADGVLVLSTPIFIAGAKRLAELALGHKVPSLFGPKHHVIAGGLMSYSPDRADLYRRAAVYVDKILKGANPAELPVEQPTKFELVINLKTAKMLGIQISPLFLTRASEVIE
jgi:ABC-type uncharacterized transport system substrate-binding protein